MSEGAFVSACGQLGLQSFISLTCSHQNHSSQAFPLEHVLNLIECVGKKNSEQHRLVVPFLSFMSLSVYHKSPLSLCK